MSTLDPRRFLRPMHLLFLVRCIFVINSGMNLRHLHAFATIIDVGGLAKAATRLHLSQPALSRQIQALEADLGVALFDRIGRRVQLTSQGEDLLLRSRRLLAEAESLGERARELKRGETGILRVAATPQVIENLLAEFLTRYRRRHPGVEVHLVEDGGARLLARLERGEVHLSITPVGMTRFEGRLLYPIHVVAALPSAHRLARRRLLEIAELEHEPLLLPQRGFGWREWFTRAISRISGRACCWRVRHRTRSSRWRQPITRSQSFPRTSACHLTASAQFRWFIAARRSAGGPTSHGTRSGFWLPMLSIL